MSDDEFPLSPKATEPLLEHAIDIEGLEGGRHMHRTRSGTPYSGLRLTVRGPPQHTASGESGTGLGPAYALALRGTDGASPSRNGDGVQEMEVEILTEAVADAVADAVGEVVQEAVQEAVQTAIDEARFDFKANIYTLIAVTGAVLLERGVWNTWDYFFGDSSLASNVGSLVLGLTVLLVIRILNLPLATTIPGR